MAAIPSMTSITFHIIIQEFRFFLIFFGRVPRVFCKCQNHLPKIIFRKGSSTAQNSGSVYGLYLLSPMLGSGGFRGLPRSPRKPSAPKGIGDKRMPPFALARFHHGKVESSMSRSPNGARPEINRFSKLNRVSQESIEARVAFSQMRMRFLRSGPHLKFPNSPSARITR